MPHEILWAQAMLFTSDVTNKSGTTSREEGKSPCKLWFGSSPTPDHLRPFGVIGCARRSLREHEMAQRGEKCVYLGIPRNFRSDTVSVLLVTTRNIVERQAVQRVDGPDKTGRNGVGNKDLGTKPGGDKSVMRKEAAQLDIQELEMRQQSTLQELIQET